jgi:hypothetical protein
MNDFKNAKTKYNNHITIRKNSLLEGYQVLI